MVSLEKWRKMIPLLADIILVFHFCIVIFVTSGFFLIPIGYKFNWKWIANKKLRVFHIGLMIFITVETFFGMTCPLTYIENNLRGIYGSTSFIGYWIQKIVYWDFPNQFFIIVYFLFLCWTFLMLKLYPPKNIIKN